MSDVPDAALCKYTYELGYEGDGGNDALFENIHHIYVHAHGTARFPTDKNDIIPFFDSQNLAALTACSLEKAPPTFNEAREHLPVYILDPSSSTEPPQSSVASRTGNLIVSVDLTLEDGSFNMYRVNPGKLVILQVSFFQHDALDVDSFNDSHCARAFDYTDNRDHMLQLLTDGLHYCLSRSYNLQQGYTLR